MNKPTFSELYTTHNVSTTRLAGIAGVQIETIDRMLIGRPVLQATAIKVLTAFSSLTEQEYTLDNVDVNLYMIVADQSEVANLMRQIEDTYTSAQQGLQGLAQGTSQHKIVTAKQENIATQFNDLTKLIGDEATEQFFMNLDIKPEQK